MGNRGFCFSREVTLSYRIVVTKVEHRSTHQFSAESRRPTCSRANLKSNQLLLEFPREIHYFEKRELKQTPTTTTATREPPNKRSNEQNNGYARTF